MTDALPYAEDAVGLTRRVWACLLPVPVAQAVVTALAPVAVWSTTLGAAVALEVFAVVLVVDCAVRGIRVTPTEVRMGGCRRAERLRHQGKPAPRVRRPQSRFRAEFAVPVDAVRSARVLDRAEAARLPRRTGAGRRQGVADLRTPLADAVLELRVDLARARVPALPGTTVEQLAVYPTSRRYVLTDRWLIATRRPAELRAALAAAGIRLDGAEPEPQPAA